MPTYSDRLPGTERKRNIFIFIPPGIGDLPSPPRGFRKRERRKKNSQARGGMKADGGGELGSKKKEKLILRRKHLLMLYFWSPVNQNVLLWSPPPPKSKLFLYNWHDKGHVQIQLSFSSVIQGACPSWMVIHQKLHYSHVMME